MNQEGIRSAKTIITALSSTSYVECDSIPLVELFVLAKDLIDMRKKGAAPNG